MSHFKKYYVACFLFFWYVLGTFCGSHSTDTNPRFLVSPDKKILLMVTKDAKACLFHIPDGEPLGTCRQHASAIQSVLFSLDGKKLFFADADQSMWVWSLTEMGYDKLIGFSSSPDDVSSVIFSPDGKQFVVGTKQGHVLGFDAEKVKDPLFSYDEHHQQEVTAAVYAPTGEWLATGGQDGHIIVSNPSGQILYQVDGTPGSVTALIASEDANRLLVQDQMGKVKILQRDEKTKRFIGIGDVMPKDQASIAQLAWLPHGLNTVTFIDSNQLFRLFSLSTGQEYFSSPSDQSEKTLLYALSDNGNTLAQVSPDSKIRIYMGFQPSVTPLPPIIEFASPEPVDYLTFLTSDGSQLLTISKDHHAHIWAIQTTPPQVGSIATPYNTSSDGSFSFSSSGLSLALYRKPSSSKILDIVRRPSLTSFDGWYLQSQPAVANPLLSFSFEPKTNPLEKEALLQVEDGALVYNKGFTNWSLAPDGLVSCGVPDVHLDGAHFSSDGNWIFGTYHQQCNLGKACMGYAIAVSNQKQMNSFLLRSQTDVCQEQELFQMYRQDLLAFVSHGVKTGDPEKVQFGRLTFDSFSSQWVVNPTLSWVAPPLETIAFLRFSPDGNSLLVGMQSGSLFFLKTNTVEVKSSGHLSGIKGPLLFSPDGLFLIGEPQTENGETAKGIFVFDANTLEIRGFIPVNGILGHIDFVPGATHQLAVSILFQPIQIWSLDALLTPIAVKEQGGFTF